LIRTNSFYGITIVAMQRRFTVAFAMAALLGAAACGGGGTPAATPGYSAPPAPKPAKDAAPWPAPSDPLVRAKAAGVDAARKEFFEYHIHAHLDVFVNGEAEEVPAALGIDTKDPGVKRFDEPDGSVGWGGITMCERPCISPLHTHDATGVVHVEAPTRQDFRLGQLFTEWGVHLDERCVGGYCAPAAAIAVFVDGKRVEGDPAAIVFEDKQAIAIVIGSPPDDIPDAFTGEA
jgi:hypothetical protein